MHAVLFLFHRDLRLVDHRGLRRAAAMAAATQAEVVPAFVFTPEQVGAGNRFKSDASIRFMVESLDELSRDLAAAGSRLVVLHAGVLEALDAVRHAVDLAAVVETADYTPYAKQRQASVSSWCRQHGIGHELVHDLYLTTPGSVRNKSGKPYQKFTPFWNAARLQPVDRPEPGPEPVPWMRTVPPISAEGPLLDVSGTTATIAGGRRAALRRLSALPPAYAKTRDLLTASTTGLSAHNHFGTVSIREVYDACRAQPDLLRQLYWRDFYAQIVDAFADLYGVGPYEFVGRGEWRRDAEAQRDFEDWCAGRTGHELVDAGMRELAASGTLHNRLRMVCASYLIKELGVYWRWGEAWFARHLVDYDFALNFGNWAWVASVLPFSQAPFRRQDPERAAQRFDPDRRYRTRWLNVPQLPVDSQPVPAENAAKRPRKKPKI